MERRAVAWCGSVFGAEVVFDQLSQGHPKLASRSCLQGDEMCESLAGVVTEPRDDPDVKVRQGLPCVTSEVDAEVEVRAGPVLQQKPEEAPQEQDSPESCHFVPFRHDLTTSRYGLGVLLDEDTPPCCSEDFLWWGFAVAEAKRTILVRREAIEDGTCSNHDAPHLPCAPNATLASGIINYNIFMT